MKRNIIPLFVAALMACATATAQQVSEQASLQAARNFMSRHGVAADQVEEVASLSRQYSHLRFYAPRNGRGYLILSDQYSARPVVGYSADGQLEGAMPPQLAYLLAQRDAEMDQERLNPSTEKGGQAQSEWQTLLKPQAQAKTAGVKPSVQPMLKSSWSQYPRYNIYCPYDTACDPRMGDHVVVGCVATAMAQVIRYWEYPLHGTGSHSYQSSNYGVQSANFGAATYRYDLMPWRLDSASTTEEIEAVALLSYHCGVACDMDYTREGSGSFVTDYGMGRPSAKTALPTYFGYSPDLNDLWQDEFETSDWVETLKGEISQRRPIIYSAADDSAGGHAFVLDGYDTADYFHIDWGWDGSFNGYYLITAMTPRTYNFRVQGIALVGVEPLGRLRISSTELSHSASEGLGYATIYGSANATEPWRIEGLPEWVTLNEAQTHVNDTVFLGFVFAANETGEPRAGEAVLVQNGDTINLKFAQFACLEEEMCVLSVRMNDAFGDGWGNTSLRFEDTSGYLFASLSLATGHTELTTVGVCGTDPLVLKWSESVISGECGFLVRNSSGDTLAYLPVRSNQHNFSSPMTVETPCTLSSCPTTAALTARPMAGGTFHLTWENTADSTIIVLNRLYPTGYTVRETDTLRVAGGMCHFVPKPRSRYDLYAAAICDDGSYGQPSNVVSVTVETVSIDPVNATRQQIALYPNPASERVTVDFGGWDGARASWTLYDMMGRAVANGECQQGSTIDVSSLTAGVYIFAVKDADHLAVEKLHIR